MSAEGKKSTNTGERTAGKKVGISTHVLDTSRGKPAANVTVSLYKNHGDSWIFLNQSKTSLDGRCADLMGEDKSKYVAGRYKIVFKVEEYFKNMNTESLYPSIEIIFDARNNEEHYHVPLLLNPFGFSTYRGS